MRTLEIATRDVAKIMNSSPTRLLSSMTLSYVKYVSLLDRVWRGKCEMDEIRAGRGSDLCPLRL